VPTLQLDPTLTSPSIARAWIATHLQDSPLRIMETATLLISEVVTHAVLHAHTPISVSLDLAADLIRVEVTDANPALSWVSERQSLDTEIGEGFGVVDVLSTSWGVQKTHGGNVVWFELRRE
jgi:hypothetical protein